jgi:hypothetical protein
VKAFFMDGSAALIGFCSIALSSLFGAKKAFDRAALARNWNFAAREIV